MESYVVLLEDDENRKRMSTDYGYVVSVTPWIQHNLKYIWEGLLRNVTVYVSWDLIFFRFTILITFLSYESKVTIAAI